jgi:hypothetical protein
LSQPHDPPEQVLVEIEKILADMSSSSGNAVDAPISLCGRVINAVIWEEELWTLICREQIVHIGSFIRLSSSRQSDSPHVQASIPSIAAFYLMLSFLALLTQDCAFGMSPAEVTGHKCGQSFCKNVSTHNQKAS